MVLKLGFCLVLCYQQFLDICYYSFFQKIDNYDLDFDIDIENDKCFGDYSGTKKIMITPTYNPTLFNRDTSYNWLFDLATDSASRPVGVTGAHG